MENSNPIFELKQECKKLAAKLKQHRKDYGEKDEFTSYEYRNTHIAYCELRGRTRDQIEKPREGNNPNEAMIKRIKGVYTKKIEDWRYQNEETVCGCD